MSDGKLWRDSAVRVPTETELHGGRLFVTYIRYAHTVSYYPGTRMHGNGISHLREAVGKVH